MKPVIISTAAAVLLLISLANHRQQIPAAKSSPEISRITPECRITSDTKSNLTSDEGTLSEPVNLSGKINFFLVSY